MEAAPYEIVFEDEYLAVVIKPAGVVVHPAPGTKSVTLVEALAAVMPLAGPPGRPGVVHRLDKDTSGLLIVAKKVEALESLQAAMKSRTIRREYLALVLGRLRMATGRIEAPIGRRDRDRTRMGVVASGREAVTEFEVLEEFERCCLIEARLQTGRTHQVRVHLSHIGHPIVGDQTYGPRAAQLARRLGIARPFLHAARIVFDHPIEGDRLDIRADLPEDLKLALARAREDT